MKFCSQCGTKLPDEAKFCENCGAHIEAPRQSAPRESISREPDVPKKKTLGQKMMDNFHTNMALQRERRKNIKWWYWVIIAVALAYFMGACTLEEKTPQQEDLENYVKGKLTNPDSYEFDRMEEGREYPYLNALSILRTSIEKQMKDPNANIDSLRREDRKVQKAVQDLGDDYACREYTLHFRYQPVKTHPTRLMGIAVARYDADGKLMVITLRPDTLNRNPALQMLKQKGYL